MYYDRLSELGIKLTRRRGQEKTKCPNCGDGRKNKHDKSLSVNIDNGTYNCHNDCGFKGSVAAQERKREARHYERPDKGILAAQNRNERVLAWFNGRGISEKTLQRFVIFNKMEWMPQTGKLENCICFPYFRGMDLVNVKFRDGRKNFRMSKGAELILYNLNSIEKKTKAIIVEGEIDTLSLYEAGVGQDNLETYDEIDPKSGEKVKKERLDYFSEYGILSVPNGASTSGNPDLVYLDNCSDWLINLEEIIIATDNDKAGRILKDELIRRLGVEKCKFVNYPTESVVQEATGTLRPCKDMNEVLISYGAEGVKSLIQNAEGTPVEGIYMVEDVFPTMLDNFRAGIKLAPSTRFPSVDDYFRWKKGDINLWTGYGNHGKTTAALQMMLIKSRYDGWKWAIFSPENYPALDFYDDLIEMDAGKPLQAMSEDEYVECSYFINKHFFYVYPEDSHDILSIHEKFRHLILKKGVDGVMIDPFNQIDHLQKAYQREDQYLSVILKDIKRFALLNSVSYNIIAHPKNPNKQEDKSLPVVDMYDIAGGAMWGNKADQIISYYRPNYHQNKTSPEVQLHIQKVKRKRTGGQPGSVDLFLHWETRRFKDANTGFCPLDAINIKRVLSQENNQIKSGYGYEQPKLELPTFNPEPNGVVGNEVSDDWDDVPFK